VRLCSHGYKTPHLLRQLRGFCRRPLSHPTATSVSINNLKMSSKQVSFRKRVRDFLHISSNNQQICEYHFHLSSPRSYGRPFPLAPQSLDPPSSRPIGGPTDLAIGTVVTSLTALKEISSLAGKIPYISPVAGIILQALKMRDVSPHFLS
jgi:hypothetical protein